MKSSISDLNLLDTAEIAYGIPQTPFQKETPENSIVINLPPINSKTVPKADFFQCISSRISKR